MLLFLFMRKRIQLAMGCVKETSKAIISMPIIILFPVFQALGFMVFMIVWSVYAANLASMGEFSTNTFQAGPISVSVSMVLMRRSILNLYLLSYLIVYVSYSLSGEIIRILRLCKAMCLVSPLLLLLDRTIHSRHGRNHICHGSLQMVLL